MAVIDWGALYKKIGAEETERRWKQKRTRVEGFLNQENTVSQVLELLKGLNPVESMGVKKFCDHYDSNKVKPLEKLADGMSSTPADIYHTDFDYVLKRNDEHMCYVIRLDATGLLDDRLWK